MRILSLASRLRRDFAEAEVLRKAYECWNHESTADIQLARLREVWDDCTNDIPYYASLVAQGRAPREIRTWDDFRAIPELNREILQKGRAEFTRHSGPPDLIRMTGGSTGNPVHFGVWKSEDRLLRLIKLTLWIRAGYRLGDRLFLIWGHSHLLGTGWRRHLNHWIRRTKDALLGYRRVDAYLLDPVRCRDYARRLLAFRPNGLIGYASALDSFVRMNHDFAGEFRSLGLRFVIPCAEPPPKEDTFELLRATFSCPVIQEFGGVDFGQVASQFDGEPFMVFPDQNILEAMPPGQPGEGGAALLTSLYRRYLPLVRYRQGDRITGVERDPHGHVHSFDRLEGRVNDMIRLGSGVEIHSVAIFHCIHQEPAILNIQMVLEDSGPLLILATLEPRLAPEVERRIRHRLGQIAPELAGIPIETAPDVPTTRAGKRRWFMDRRTGVC